MAARVSMLDATLTAGEDTYTRVTVSTRGTQLTVKARNRLMVQRDDVAAVEFTDTKQNHAVIRFADGTTWQAKRTGGCRSCGGR